MRKAKATKRVRPKPRPLRGELLIKAARTELGRMTTLSPQSDPVNMLRLAKRLGVTRQALYNNDLGPVVAEYAELQRKNFSTAVAAASQRRPLEERIGELEKENKELRLKLDGWIERWVTVEYNARILGTTADKLFAPIPPPARKRPNPKGGKKTRG